MSNVSISISIGAIETNLMTDAPLSFDAIETLLTRVVTSTLNVYMSLPEEDRVRVIYDFDSSDDDDEDD
jgi:hypothetical protein